MNNFDLIDAYLDKEMTAEELLRFEQRLSVDAELKQELGFQQELIEGIQEARRLELKARLDNVAVGGNAGQSLTLAKIIAGTLLVGFAGWGIYNFYGDKASEEFMPIAENNEESIEELIGTVSDAEESAMAEEQESSGPAENMEASIDETETAQPSAKNTQTTRQVIQPDIKKPELVTAFDGAEDSADSLQAPGTTASSKKDSNLSTIDVSIDNTRKKYTFHYQFKGGKLFLYGDFSDGLYEILEFDPRNGKALFLYFQNKYYTLDNTQERIVRLEAIKNKSLIAKLEKARGVN